MNVLEHSLALGPLGVSLGQLVLVGALLMALAVGALMKRRHGASVSDALFNALFLGLIGARIAFVIRYFESFDSPLDWIDIRDRGFEPLAGLAVGLAYLSWRLWRHPAQRRTLCAAIAAGAASWSLAVGALLLTRPQPTALSTTPLATLDDADTSLAALHRSAAKPMVVNLWASWCPPCRREMPMLEQAQQERDDVRFVFVNQGESAAAVNAYLRNENLSLNHIYRDPDMAFGQEVGAVAMPTTLYFDARGQLIDRHFGELSRATLERSLRQLE